VIYTIWLVITVVRHNRKLCEIRREEKELHPEAFEDEIKPGEATEYRSRRTLFGLPLIHISNGRPGEKTKPAVGWIAIGQRAYGILFAAGGVAIGGISMGGLSIGILSVGGASIGLVALGGFALGGLAWGGAAIGILASGGLAVAWLGAQGGLAIAHDFALGGMAMANHANDAAAKEFFDRFSCMDLRDSGKRNLVTTLCWLPLILSVVVWQVMNKHKQRKQSAR
jgi:hypothetical protein